MSIIGKSVDKVILDTLNYNREEWLTLAVKELSNLFESVGYKVPEVRVTCSWPTREVNKVLGQCWSKSASNINVNEIFISPTIHDSVQALEVLTHELVHAIDNCEHGHRKEFIKIMKDIGLEGKPTATHAGERLHGELESVFHTLGEYPNAGMIITDNKKKDKSRQLKATCLNCSAIWRMSNQWLQLAKVCPCCQSDDIEIQ